MTFDIHQADLGKLNSMTKYPSIPTYHTFGDKGMLQDALPVAFAGRVLGSEKVDGTNCRLIFCPDGSALVDSREDLLWERRDLIGTARTQGSTLWINPLMTFYWCFHLAPVARRILYLDAVKKTRTYWEQIAVIDGFRSRCAAIRDREIIPDASFDRWPSR